MGIGKRKLVAYRTSNGIEKTSLEVDADGIYTLERGGKTYRIGKIASKFRTVPGGQQVDKEFPTLSGLLGHIIAPLPSADDIIERVAKIIEYSYSGASGADIVDELNDVAPSIEAYLGHTLDRGDQ